MEGRARGGNAAQKRRMISEKLLYIIGMDCGTGEGAEEGQISVCAVREVRTEDTGNSGAS